jgi:hypothetical protein
MSVMDNKTVAQRVIDEAINGRNLEALDVLVAPGFANHDSANPQITDLGGFKAWLQGLWAGFPDCSVQLTNNRFADGKIIESLWGCNMLVVLQQLDLVPNP